MRKIVAASVLVSMMALVACGGESSTGPAAASPAPATSASSATAAAAPAPEAPVAAVTPAVAPAPVAEPAPAPAPEPVKVVVVADGDAKVGDTTKCLVSGDEFVVKADSPKVEHAKKTYYFASDKSAKDFKANPKKYLTTATAKTDTKAADKKADAKTDTKAADKKADAKTDTKAADKKAAPAAAPAAK